MPAYGDLVHQTTVGTGTGNLTLTVASGKRTFLIAFGTGGTNTFDYFISHREAAEWERGTGHESAGALVRDTVLASSNAGAAVNFSAGNKDITNDQPAGLRVDNTRSVVSGNGLTGGGNLTADRTLAVGAGTGITVNADDVALTVPVTAVNGGTGQTAYAVGDLLVGGATNTLTKLADIATGNALISGGVGVAPSWGKVAIGTHTSGGAALTKADDTNVTLALGGAPTTALLTAASITAGWTGTLSVARGGTGSSTAPTALTALGAVAKAGDTMTGALSLGYASPIFSLSAAAAGQANVFFGNVGGLNRWAILPGNAAAEGGANAGSDFAIYRYSDAAAYLGSPLHISRATGAVTFSGDLAAGGNITGGAIYSSVYMMSYNAAASGIIYLGSNAAHYLSFDGTNYNMVGGDLALNGQFVNVALAAKLPLAGGNMTGTLSASYTTGTIAAVPVALAAQGLQIFAGASDAAYLTFHCPGRFIGAFGLDTDNNWKVGGGSYGAVSYKLWHEGNLTPAPLGQCILKYVNSTTITLFPFGGNQLTINRARQTVPNAGVSLGVGGLSAGGTYYVYAWMNGATMTLEASGTAPTVDTVNGLRIKTGDATRTLVGLVYLNTGPIFADSDQLRYTRTWFNDKGIIAKHAGGAGTTGSTSFIATASAIIPLLWKDEQIALHLGGTGSMATGAPTAFGATIYLDPSTELGGCSDIVHGTTNGYNYPISGATMYTATADQAVVLRAMYKAYSGTATVTPTITGMSRGVTGAAGAI